MFEHRASSSLLALLVLILVGSCSADPYHEDPEGPVIYFGRGESRDTFFTFDGETAICSRATYFENCFVERDWMVWDAPVEAAERETIRRLTSPDALDEYRRIAQDSVKVDICTMEHDQLKIIAFPSVDLDRSLADKSDRLKALYEFLEGFEAKCEAIQAQQ